MDASVSRTDGGIPVDGGSTVALIGDVLTCKRRAQAGGLPSGSDLLAHDIDLSVFPDALCNDGTGGVFYFRRYKGAQNRNKWVIQLKGGGSCAGPDSCAQRWCSVLTNFGATQMTHDINDPNPRAAIGGVGILNRTSETAVGDNPFSDYNQVYLNYCSSDEWSGRARDVVADAHWPCEPGPGATCPGGAACPEDGKCTDVPVQYRIDFLGASILDATIATLRRDGVGALHDASGELPDLDEAEEVVLSGASGGGAGVIRNADRIGKVLRDHNVACTPAQCPLRYDAMIDSIFGPSQELLDWNTTTVCSDSGGTLCDFETAMRALEQSGSGAFWNAVGDDSCLAFHGGDDTDWKCGDNGHVIRNHVTTPFFLRMGLTDENISGHYLDFMFGIPDGDLMTLKDFAVRVHDEAYDLATTASEEEVADIDRQPGVFTPICNRHETLSDDDSVFNVTINPGSGPLRMFDVWRNWRAGSGTRIAQTGDPQGADTVCP